jgi:RNA polymerase sigma factor (sigma-70 family)
MDTAERRAAYESLLVRHLPTLRRVAWSYARGASEDLLQDIALALWTALPRFRGDSSERTWVYRVAHNTAISFVAQQRRRIEREDGGDLSREPASSDSPEREAIDAQRRERLHTAVQELPLDERQIVVLYLEGLSAAEIEAVTGVSAGAVATRLTRARHKLKATVLGIVGQS